MEKYGLFNFGSDKPGQVVEGDYLIQSSEFVVVYEDSKSGNRDNDKQVAVVHLGPGQAVKKIK